MPEPVSLDNQLFADAIAHYIDYHKPDPIARRQLESWTLNWTQGSGGCSCSGNRNSNNNNSDNINSDNNNDNDNINNNDINNNNNNDNDNDNDNSSNGDSGDDWTPDRFLEGTLEICGEYAAVTLALRCSWAEARAEPSTTTCGDDGRLSFVCGVASCRWIEEKDGDDKAKCKIRKKMVARLRKDSYISKIVAATASVNNKNRNKNRNRNRNRNKNANPNATCLARASIYANSSTFELEERVDVSEPVAESLRRALWSSAPSSLDVVEVVLALPSLPCFHAGAGKGNGNGNGKNATTATTKLANRAKLRMLEDAMLDECEKEGDERILEDLAISHANNDNSNSNSNSTKPKSNNNANSKGNDAVDPSIPPRELFRYRQKQQEQLDGSLLYGSFDESTGFPLTSADGEPLTKSASKRIKKLYDAHAKKHEKYLSKGGQASASAAAAVVPANDPRARTDATEESNNNNNNNSNNGDERGRGISGLLDPSFVTLVAGSFGKRQGLELFSDMGPFCHVIEL